MKSKADFSDEGWGPKEVVMLLVLQNVRIKKPPVKKKFVKIKPIKEIDVPDDWGIPLMERIQERLGHRMTEYYGGYKLDGQPCNIDRLINASGLS